MAWEMHNANHQSSYGDHSQFSFSSTHTQLITDIDTQSHPKRAESRYMSKRLHAHYVTKSLKSKIHTDKEQGNIYLHASIPAVHRSFLIQDRLSPKRTIDIRPRPLNGRVTIIDIRINRSDSRFHILIILLACIKDL
jgi:hypothetical protein